MVFAIIYSLKESPLNWLGKFTRPMVVPRLCKYFLRFGTNYWSKGAYNYSNRSNPSRTSGMTNIPKSPTVCLIPVNYPMYNVPPQFHQLITLETLIGFCWLEPLCRKRSNLSFLPSSLPSFLPSFLPRATRTSGRDF